MSSNRNDTAHHRGGFRYNVLLWAFLAILLFFLLSEHRAHLLGALPYLLLAACPLMHLFMHRNHGVLLNQPDGIRAMKRPSLTMEQRRE